MASAAATPLAAAAAARAAPPQPLTRPRSAFDRFVRQVWALDPSLSSVQVANNAAIQWRLLSGKHRAEYEAQFQAELAAYSAAVQREFGANSNGPQSAGAPKPAGDKPDSQDPSGIPEVGPRQHPRNSLASAEQGELYGDASIFSAQRLARARLAQNHDFMTDLFLRPDAEGQGAADGALELAQVEGRIKDAIAEEEEEIAWLEEQHQTKRLRLQQEASPTAAPVAATTASAGGQALAQQTPLVPTVGDGAAPAVPRRVEAEDIPLPPTQGAVYIAL